jgi:hypothetical protein
VSLLAAGAASCSTGAGCTVCAWYGPSCFVRRHRGWITTESAATLVIYGLLRTADAVSPRRAAVADR